MCRLFCFSIQKELSQKEICSYGFVLASTEFGYPNSTCGQRHCLCKHRIVISQCAAQSPQASHLLQQMLLRHSLRKQRICPYRFCMQRTMSWPLQNWDMRKCVVVFASIAIVYTWHCLHKQRIWISQFPC